MPVRTTVDCVVVLQCSFATIDRVSNTVQCNCATVYNGIHISVILQYSCSTVYTVSNSVCYYSWTVDIIRNIPFVLAFSCTLVYSGGNMSEVQKSVVTQFTVRVAYQWYYIAVVLQFPI